MKPFEIRKFRGALAGLVALLLLASVGCGSSGGSDPAAAADNGQVVIGLTDASGDFAAYAVDVVSLTLTKANGAVVHTLPLSTRVDFAQYVDLTEFLTAATVPSGAYVAATMVLDYAQADIQVETPAGDIAPADNVVDADGNPVGLLTLTVHMDGDRMLWVAPGLPSHMTLDFDLAASNRVEFAGDGTSTVTVEPTLLADVDPQAPKVHRIRGPLRDVDEAHRTFTLILRPFVHAMTGGQAPFGLMPVYTDADTVFDLSGTTYTGDAGLAALAAMGRFTAVVAKGDLMLAPRRFLAREVFAGSSVPGGDEDAATGNVVSRAGDLAVLRGAFLQRAGGQLGFLKDVEVNLAGAEVTREGDTDAHALSEVSVGQRILVFGDLDSQADPAAMTATQVRLLPTTLRGVVAGTGSPLVLSLSSVDGRDPELFDFAGTGTAPEDDDRVDLGALPALDLEVGDPVKVSGFVSGFGQAPPDFHARTLVDLGAVRALMTVGWMPASGTAIPALDATGMDLSMDGTGLFHHVFQGFQATDLAGTAPRFEPPADGQGRFSIMAPHRRVTYDLWEDFAADLAQRLEGGARIRGLVATGTWNAAGDTMTGDVLDVTVH